MPHQTRTERDEIVVMAATDNVSSPIPVPSTLRGRSSSEVIKQINVSNAKILAFLLVICMISYHSILKSINGDKFSILLTHLS